MPARPVLYPAVPLASFVQSVGPLRDHWPADLPLRRRVDAASQAALSDPERELSDHRLQRVEWTCRCNDCAAMMVWAESRRADPLTR